MPALFALGLHQALVAVQAGLLPSERLFAFLDDIYVVCSPDRVADVYGSLQAELWRHARIQVHQGKTQLWNRGGVMLHGTDALTAAARIEDASTGVWSEALGHTAGPCCSCAGSVGKVVDFT